MTPTTPAPQTPWKVIARVPNDCTVRGFTAIGVDMPPVAYVAYREDAERINTAVNAMADLLAACVTAIDDLEMAEVLFQQAGTDPLAWIDTAKRALQTAVALVAKAKDREP